MPVTDFRAGADTQGQDLFWVEEANWGVVPAGPPTLHTARITSQGLTKAKTTTRSQEIRGDRQISDRPITAFQTNGPINYEFSLDTPGGASENLVDLFQGAMFGTWGTELGISGTINASAVDDSFNDNLAAGTMFANVQVGQWIRAKGFVTGANTGVHQVTSKPSNDKIIVSTTLTTEAGDADETISGQMMRDAKVARSYVMEVSQTDLTPDVLQAYLGNMISTWAMTFPLEGIITGNFGMIGKDRNAASATTVGDGSPNARSTTAVSETVTLMPSIRRNGAVLTGVPRSIAMNLDNGLRRQGAIGTSGAAQGVGLGSVNVTGTVEAYLLDKSLIDDYDAHTWSQMDWRVQNAAGDDLVFTIPQVVLSNENPAAAGVDADVIQNYNWESRTNAALGYTMQLDFLPA